MSFSSLAAGHDMVPKPRANGQDSNYDQFVFADLPRGTKTGDMLHDLFENADFANPKHWERIIDETLQQYMPATKTAFHPMIMQMLNEVFSASIAIDGESF